MKTILVGLKGKMGQWQFEDGEINFDKDSDLEWYNELWNKLFEDENTINELAEQLVEIM